MSEEDGVGRRGGVWAWVLGVAEVVWSLIRAQAGRGPGWVRRGPRGAKGGAPRAFSVRVPFNRAWSRGGRALTGRADRTGGLASARVASPGGARAERGHRGGGARWQVRLA
ncbi:unnamed protein product [Dicrocoelium dendriticum]|nr:unnamed protein product [Dicrocoelium dendriticum]